MAIHALKTNYMLGEYRIERLLGEGGFGLTYLGFDTNLDKYVAIKEYMPSEHAVRSNDSKIIAKSQSSSTVYDWGLNAFLNEAKTLAKFEVPNIVRIYRFFKANGTAYIVMEYCEGGCLIDRISKKSQMPEDLLKNIISDLISGLQLVHDDGILHRDIKPDNIMFRSDGTPVLIDFGAARLAIGTKSRKVTTIISPGYAPMEQYSSNGCIGPWSDIYSLSAVAYLCLTGERPPDIMNRLHEDTIEKLSLRNNSSVFLKSIDKGLELQVNDRPQSLSEWSSNWIENNTEILKKSKKWQSHNTPIYADKRSQSNDKSVIGSITARSKIDSYEQTIVNIKSVELDNNKNKSIRFIITLLFLGGLGAVGYLGYEKYFLRNTSEILVSEEPKRFFENQKAENIMANQLQDTPQQKELLEKIKKDEADWKSALNQHSIEAYEQYQNQNPKGLYIDQVSDFISKIKTENLKKKELFELQTQKSEQNENQKLIQLAQTKIKLVRDTQFLLQKLKFKSINTDGVLDQFTKNSIKSYQKIKGLDQNGLPSKSLLYQLNQEEKWPGRQVGESFSDCPDCPKMIVLPSGSYTMGSNHGKDNEKPPHHVAISEFSISETEITLSQWTACVNDNICIRILSDTHLFDDNHAIIQVNMADVNQYLAWINTKSTQKYRLPSEAEWEYAARAGTTSAYSWGDEIGQNNTLCDGCSSDVNENSIYLVKNFPANNYGLYDMHGNVWEWTADCWHNNYLGAPSDNLPWEPNDCNQFVVRSGSRDNKPEDLKSTNRGAMKPQDKRNSLGFRIAVDSN